MRTVIVMVLAALMLTAGCGVNKQYVADQIAASESKTGTQLQSVQEKTDSNAAEMARLQQLASQFEQKTDMAINKASGFEKYQIIWSGTINFAFDSYEIDGIAASVLDEGGGKMAQVPNALIEITGYTDKAGSPGYNLVLGDKRASAAKRYLADKFGVPLYRMFTNSYGKQKPVALPDERNAASKNRRVTLTVWGVPQ